MYQNNLKRTQCEIFIEASPPFPLRHFSIGYLTPNKVRAMAWEVIDSCFTRNRMGCYGKGGCRTSGLGRTIDYWPISDLPIALLPHPLDLYRSTTWDLKFIENFIFPEIF